MRREHEPARLVLPELIDTLTVTQRLLARDLSSLLEEEGTTLDQWRILRSLTIDQGRSMGELAVSLEIPHPTLTRLVDGLVDFSYLYRTQSGPDRRRVSIHLSDRGQLLLGRLEALAAAHEAALSGRLGNDAVSTLVTSLKAIRDRLRE